MFWNNQVLVAIPDDGKSAILITLPSCANSHTSGTGIETTMLDRLASHSFVTEKFICLCNGQLDASLAWSTLLVAARVGSWSNGLAHLVKQSGVHAVPDLGF